jgi:hypothetical protein
LTPQQQPSHPGRFQTLPTSASKVREFTYGLQRVVKVMGHYLADIAASPDIRTGSQPSDISPWVRALAEARCSPAGPPLSADHDHPGTA